MSRTMPPFPAVRAFEAVARLGCLRKASEELCVTTSAVSHQIKKLEAFLGRSLFYRTTEGLRMNEDGKRYLNQVSPIIRQLEDSTRELMDGAPRGRLRLMSTPGFANRWLIPRLDQFSKQCPDIEIELNTGAPPHDFASAACDVLIHWGSESLPGADITPFFMTRRFCVASPDLLQKCGQPGHPSDLAHFTLLHDTHSDGWDDYVASIGGVDFDHSAGPRFANCDLSMSAVESGQGIGLAYALIADRALRDGKITRVLPFEIGPYLIHSVAVAAEARSNPRITAFTDWLLAEAGRQERMAENYPKPIRM